MRLSIVIKATLSILLIPACLQARGGEAAQSGAGSSAAAVQDEDIMDISLEENLMLPAVPAKQHEGVVSYMRRQATDLVKQKYKVESMRNGEVIIATVYSDDLFSPNETELIPSAGGKLRPFMTFLHNPEMYKVLLVMHSDDTGSEEYTDALTEKRVFAVCDWFSQNNADMSQLVPYAMGASEPLVPNDTRANRTLNRRLEIYLVPGKMLIDMAKSGALGN